MKTNQAFILLLIVLPFTRCKKEDAQQFQCPASQTFVSEITSYVGEYASAILEGSDGSLHVIAPVGGNYVIHQFTDNGQFVRTVNLGPSDSQTKLSIADGYYLCKSTYTGIPGQQNPGILTAWKQLGRAINTQNGECFPVLQFDTLAYEEPGTIAPVTEVKKIDFTGNTLWARTFSGRLGNLQFTTNGSVYLTATDFYRINYRALINGQLYELYDTTRPTLGFTDTLLWKDANNIIVSKIDADNGQLIWETQAPVAYAMESSSDVLGAAVNTGVYVACDNRLYKFSQSGTYLGVQAPVYNESACAGGVITLHSTYITDKMFIRGGSTIGGSYFAQLDGNGSIVWQQQTNHINDFVPLQSGGFLNNLSYTSELYNSYGAQTGTVNWTSLIKSTQEFQYTYIPQDKFYCSPSCSSDILTVLWAHYNNPSSPNGYSTRTWLIRANANGEL